MHNFLGLIGLLSGLSLSSAAPSTQNITSDAYFYGESPPVYPSPEGTGSGSWAAAYKKAKAFVAQLTPEEKVNLTAGVSGDTGCSGNIAAIPRLNFPGLCVSDAGNGLRGTDYVNSWPSGIHAGASWNKKLARQRAFHMGEEFRKKGVNVLLGPVVGPLGRVVEGGRNWEAFSNDPYHTGALVYETVEGIQSAGVGACTKVSVQHYIGNEQETNRNPETVDGLDIASVSSNIDDKTMHELYLWPFQDAVYAGSVSIMCSYQRINNSYGCQNSKTLNGLLKTELGFQGYVMTDWYAQHGGIAAANAGLDMVMPYTDLWGSNLTDAISNGTMEASRLDDMAVRIMASWYQVNQNRDFPTPGAGMPTDVTQPHQAVIGRSSDSRSILLQSAIEGHVLVKNTNKALPLQSPKLLSIFGYDAKAPDSLSTSSEFMSNSPPVQNNHTLYVGGGSGANSPAYMIAPLDALQQQAYEDGTSLLWNIHSEDPEIDTTSDACLVFINAYATEGFDRPGLVHEESDALVTNVAGKCSNTIVTIHNAGIRLVGSWIDHENVTAVIFAHLPGQDTGKALVELLYGRANPSGKLPYTVAKSPDEYGSLLHPSQPEGQFGLFPQSDFTEGVFIDYRAFDKHGIDPQFEFGFGLSYTTFDYSGLSIKKAQQTNKLYPDSGPVQEGGNPRLWDETVTVSAEIKNSGSAYGDEVAQLYLGIPNAPMRQLRGFEKVGIRAGQSVKVEFSLTRRDLSVWDTEAQEWKLQAGEYQVYVGRSSRDLPLKGRFSI
ncbi:putative beta-glucosidase M [Aspergillus ambiguus]|uniref:beta-glucosidase n=1 Tax=Aspergillus ambiguus TaxID=176160 RepID=UPI003CCD386F